MAMKIDLVLLKEQLQTFINNNESYLPSSELNSTLRNKQFLASESWRSGGMQGGNCWGDMADTSIDSDDENNIVSLDKFLEEFYPDTPFKIYRKILDKISYGEYCNSEYYGNYSDYKYKYITLDDIVSVFQAECDLDYEHPKSQHKYR